MSNYRSNDIPSALSSQLGWIPYTLTHNPETKKLDKKPIFRGWQHSTDSLELCRWKSRNNPDWLTGLALNPDVNKVVLCDWDNVRQGDSFSDEAMAMVKRANTLTEISTSGRGLHAIATADIDKNYKNKYLLHYGQFELYWANRFVALTFDFRSELPKVINHFDDIPSVFPLVEVKDKKYTDYSNIDSDLFYGNAPKYVITQKPFDGIMEQLRKAKNYSKFSKLYNGAHIHDGEWIPTSKFPSQSEGDLSLITRTMFFSKSQHFLSRYYSNLDDYDLRGLAYSLSDMVLKKSSLFRPKWRRRDYRISTLNYGFDKQTRWYFDEEFMEEFSAIQRDRQWRSAHKRSDNNQERIESAIDSLQERGDKVTHSAIAKYTGLARSTVIRNMKKLKV